MTKSDLSRRYGRFVVSERLFFKEPELLIAVFRMVGIVPTRAEFLFHGQVFEYVAMCDQFEAVGFGEEAPWYDLVIEQGPDGELAHAEFRRK